VLLLSGADRVTLRLPFERFQLQKPTWRGAYSSRDGDWGRGRRRSATRVSSFRARPIKKRPASLRDAGQVEAEASSQKLRGERRDQAPAGGCRSGQRTAGV